MITQAFRKIGITAGIIAVAASLIYFNIYFETTRNGLHFWLGIESISDWIELNSTYNPNGYVYPYGDAFVYVKYISSLAAAFSAVAGLAVILLNLRREFLCLIPVVPLIVSIICWYQHFDLGTALGANFCNIIYIIASYIFSKLTDYRSENAIYARLITAGIAIVLYLIIAVFATYTMMTLSNASFFTISNLLFYAGLTICTGCATLLCDENLEELFE